MIFLFIGNIIIYILFGKITLAELKDLRYRFLDKLTRVRGLVDLKVNFNLNIIEKYIAFQFLSLYMVFLTEVLYKKGEFLCLNYEKNKLKQFKIILIYVVLININYLFYAFTFDNETKTINSLNENLMFYTVNYDYFHCFIKLQEGFYKLMVNITSINMEKLWNKKTFVFDILSIFKYLLYLSYDLKAIYILIYMESHNIYFMISGFKNGFKLIMALKSFYSNYLHLKYIQSLTNYDINKELSIQGEINSKMDEEEFNKVRENNINVCIICLCEIEKGKYLNCGHIFHLECIQEWILQYKKCPTCNSPINIYSNEKTEFYNKRLRIKTNDTNNITNDNKNENNYSEELGKDEDLNPIT
jgi:E3 ubiquitin-protein ligase synoviolin